MSEKEINGIEELNCELNDIDDLGLCLEILSKKSNMVIQELADTIIQLEKENKELKEQNKSLKSNQNSMYETNKAILNRIDKAIEYIKENTMYYDRDYSKLYGYLCDIAGAGDTRTHVIVGDKELLKILEGDK